MKYSDRKKIGSAYYIYIHISYISYTHHIHITLVVPSRQCLLTYLYVACRYVCCVCSVCGYSFIVCIPQCTSCTRDNKGIWIWIWIWIWVVSKIIINTFHRILIRRFNCSETDHRPVSGTVYATKIRADSTLHMVAAITASRHSWVGQETSLKYLNNWNSFGIFTWMI